LVVGLSGRRRVIKSLLWRPFPCHRRHKTHDRGRQTTEERRAERPAPPRILDKLAGRTIQTLLITTLIKYIRSSLEVDPFQLFAPAKRLSRRPLHQERRRVQGLCVTLAPLPPLRSLPIPRTLILILIPIACKHPPGALQQAAPVFVAPSSWVDDTQDLDLLHGCARRRAPLPGVKLDRQADQSHDQQTAAGAKVFRCHPCRIRVANLAKCPRARVNHLPSDASEEPAVKVPGAMVVHSVDGAIGATDTMLGFVIH
jgi:hypothetical protein